MKHSIPFPSAKTTRTVLVMAICLLASLMNKAHAYEDDVLWKLYHESNNGWEIRGKDWCVMCKGSRGCVKDAFTVTQHCNANLKTQRWDFVGAESGLVRIRASGTDLCLTRTRQRDYVLKECGDGAYGSRQLYKGYKENGKFALQPYKTKGRFITMHHRPKHEGPHDGEEIYDQKYDKPRKSKTLYWITVDAPRQREELRIRSKKCSSKYPCGECEGDCNGDSTCRGNLKCWDRHEGQWRKRVEKGLKHPWSKIPGCSGWGEFAGDYCYDPNAVRRLIRGNENDVTL